MERASDSHHCRPRLAGSAGLPDVYGDGAVLHHGAAVLRRPDPPSGDPALRGGGRRSVRGGPDDHRLDQRRCVAALSVLRRPLRSGDRLRLPGHDGLCGAPVPGEVRHGLRPRHGGLRLRSHSLGAGGSGPDPQRESAGDVLYSGWCLSGADPAGQYPAGGAPAGPAGGPVSCLR